MEAVLDLSSQAGTSCVSRAAGARRANAPDRSEGRAGRRTDRPKRSVDPAAGDRELLCSASSPRAGTTTTRRQSERD